MSYTLYTDGSCLNNGSKFAKGGWAFILVHPNNYNRTELSGKCTENASSSRMELIAALEGLALIPDNSAVTIISDSQYLVNGITEWMPKWIERNWKNVKNTDLWTELLRQTKRLKIQTKHVFGHTGHKENEWCDSEALRQTRT